MEKMIDIKPGEMHYQDVGELINGLLEQGYHKITISLDATKSKFMEHGIVDLNVSEIRERYDRVPAAAGL